MPRVIITGGPGAGKTTLLQALASLGYATVDESARAVIAERQALGLSPRPEPIAFAKEILRRDVQKFESTADAQGWVFFDRGVVEALAMVDEVEPMPTDELAARLGTYAMHPLVFVLPPWPGIYTTDAQRDHGFEHAVAVHAGVCRWYQRCGYTLNEVPRRPVGQRARHVLRALGAISAIGGLRQDRAPRINPTDRPT
jgi:predicted ATPase